MTAKEMFKKLGYTSKSEVSTQNYIFGSRIYESDTFPLKVISFDSTFKMYACMEHFIGNTGHRLFIGIKEHKAINKQMLELGWLDE